MKKVRLKEFENSESEEKLLVLDCRRIFDAKGKEMFPVDFLEHLTNMRHYNYNVIIRVNKKSTLPESVLAFCQSEKKINIKL